MNKTRDGLLLSSAQSAPLTIEEKWSINMGEAGEKTDYPVSVVLLSVPVWYPAGSGGGGDVFFLQYEVPFLSQQASFLFFLSL